MKHSTIFIPVLWSIIAISLTSCSSSRHTVSTKPSTFVTTPVVIDGDDKEWPSPYPNYDSKALISYAVSNDRDNLYLTIKASDQRMRMKILRGGMKIWIDTTGGKNENVFIQSPMPNSIPQRSQDDRRQAQGNAADKDEQQAGNAEWKKQVAMNVSQYSLTGFGTCDGSYTSTNNNNCGIQVKLGINEYNELVWEAAIPFSTWHHASLAPRDASKPICIGFEIAALPIPARTYGGQQGGGGRMGGGGMRMSGGMGGMGGGMGRGGGRMGGGGGMRGGNRSGQNNGASEEEREILAKTTTTWVKTRLAYK